MFKGIVRWFSKKEDSTDAKTVSSSIPQTKFNIEDKVMNADEKKDVLGQNDKITDSLSDKELLNRNPSSTQPVKESPTTESVLTLKTDKNDKNSSSTLVLEKDSSSPVTPGGLDASDTNTKKITFETHKTAKIESDVEPIILAGENISKSEHDNSLSMTGVEPSAFVGEKTSFPANKDESGLDNSLNETGLDPSVFGITVAPSQTDIRKNDDIDQVVLKTDTPSAEHKSCTETKKNSVLSSSKTVPSNETMPPIETEIPPQDKYPGRPALGDFDFYKVKQFGKPSPRPACDIEELTAWMQDNGVQFGLNYLFGGKRRFITEKSSAGIWFVADLHGDIYCLQKILDHIDRTDPEASIVFMGDLFDRCNKNLETVKSVLELIKSRPGKIVWLIGNHDGALYYSEEQKKFSSRVSGHDSFCEDLNKLITVSPAYEAFGKALISFIEKLPHAIIFSDGIIVSHGGIPLQDTLEEINSIEDFNSDAARYDFIWVRPEDKEQRVPRDPEQVGTEKDRTSTAWYRAQRQNLDPSGPAMFKSCWTAFAEKLPKITQITPYCMLVGHQHPGKGYDLAQKKIPCIFLNSNLKTGTSGSNAQIAFACGRATGTPEVFVLTIDREEYNSFYAEPPQDGTVSK